MRLGEYIKNERLNRGLSQQDLAKQCNLSFVTINLIENNHRAGIKSLKTLSEFFGITIKELREMIELNNENHES